jgi:hypothetical protein
MVKPFRPIELANRAVRLISARGKSRSQLVVPSLPTVSTLSPLISPADIRCRIPALLALSKTSDTAQARKMKARSPERQIFDSSPPLVLRCCPGDQFKVFHHLADRNTQLMRVDVAREILAIAQPFCSLAEEVLVLRDEDATEFRRPFQ